MRRLAQILPAILAALLLAGCGTGTGAGAGGGTPPQNSPTLIAIAPSTTTVGASSIALSVYGSTFENGATVQWNGTSLSSSWISATEMTATIPASDIASVGSAQVTVVNPSPGGGASAPQSFKIAAAPSATTWLRSVAGISVPHDLVWDTIHGNLYVSIGSPDPAIPNTIVVVNPVTGTAGPPVAAGNNPDLLSISSDSSYLWAGLDGDYSVQRFLLPSLTKDISFSLPLDPTNNPQQPVSLEAAPASPHTLAVVPGHWGYSPPGDGVYIYDDATQRPSYVIGGENRGPYIDWIQWGGNDSTIYGNQYTTIDQGGVATLNVTSSGVSIASYNGGQVGPTLTQYDSSNGLLYSFGGVFNPASGSLIGSFDFPEYNPACTANSSLNRYFCFVANQIGAGDVSSFELWVFDLNTSALLNRVYFGATQGTEYSPVTGAPKYLAFWGNAGLALITTTAPYLGNGGLFLIDGAAINPNAAPDSSSGTSTTSYAWMASLTPQQASGSGEVAVQINGTSFTQGSTACLNCNYLQFQYLPTSYVSSTQLNVSIPATLLASPGPLPISIFDTSSNQFSTNSLAFTVSSGSGGSTQVTGLNLAGLGAAWDGYTQLLYVGTADYDGSYPNSIVAINPANAAVMQAQNVGSDPCLLSISANGQYLYAALCAATEMIQLQLPGLASQLTWTLNNPASSAVYWAGAMKSAPVSPHTTAVSLINLESDPDETGGVIIFDDNVERPDFAPGWSQGPPYDTLAWSSSDQILAGASRSGYLGGPLYEIQVSQPGAALVATGTASFNEGEIHSDFGTGLIYSDDGNVADPSTRAIVGTYNASGLVAPDSSLNSVFILGQTASQANTNNYTIDSFDQNTYDPISSITLTNLLGTPLELVRWGASGLAILTMNQNGGPPGMLYLVQDSNFITNAQMATSRGAAPRELVQLRWKAISKADVWRRVRQKQNGKGWSRKQLDRSGDSGPDASIPSARLRYRAP